MSDPLSCVVPSLHGPVLEALARSAKPMTGRQVQRVARRGSRAGVATVLEHLVSCGLVLRTNIGPASLYEANRHHLAWPAVVVLVDLRATLIQRLSEAIEQLDPAPDMAVLFGSTARGDGDEASDIDMLLTHSGEEHPWHDALASISADVHGWTGNHVHWVVVDGERWRQMTEDREPLVASVVRDGIPLLGRAQ